MNRLVASGSGGARSGPATTAGEGNFNAIVPFRLAAAVQRLDKRQVASTLMMELANTVRKQRLERVSTRILRMAISSVLSKISPPLMKMLPLGWSARTEGSRNWKLPYHSDQLELHRPRDPQGCLSHPIPSLTHQRMPLRPSVDTRP